MVQLSPLHKFYVKRAFWYLLTFLMALSLNFVLPRLRKEGPVEMIMNKTNLQGMSSADREAKVLEIKQRFNLDKSLPMQYLLYLKDTFIPFHSITTEDENGVVATSWKFGPNLGYSVVQPDKSVWDIIKGNILWTLALQVPTILLGYLVGNLLGALAAYKRGVYDKVLYPMSLLFTATPYFAVALMVVYLFGIKLEWFPAMGGYSDLVAFNLGSIAFYKSAAYHYLLPFFSLFIILMGGQAIGMRSMSIYELGTDYVKYARYLGVGDNKIVGYVFKNALLPQLTGIALAIGMMVGGSVLIEIIFSYPGIGSAMFNAVISNDYPVMQAGSLLVVFNVLVLNFIVDILIAELDPRVRAALEAEIK